MQCYLLHYREVVTTVLMAIYYPYWVSTRLLQTVEDIISVDASDATSYLDAETVEYIDRYTYINGKDN